MMLAASAVTLLTPFLKKAAEKGAEKLGESAAGTLFEKLKGSLKTPAGQEALSDLAKAPDDADSQAALRKEIRKAAEQDPQFASQLQELLSKAGAVTQTQVANVSGDQNKVAQVQGSGNVIG
jgi:hypothetical protein